MNVKCYLMLLELFRFHNALQAKRICKRYENSIHSTEEEKENCWLHRWISQSSIKQKLKNIIELTFDY